VFGYGNPWTYAQQQAMMCAAAWMSNPWIMPPGWGYAGGVGSTQPPLWGKPGVADGIEGGPFPPNVGGTFRPGA
jgi:hypothetical protein